MNSLFGPEYMEKLRKRKEEHDKKNKNVKFEFQELGLELKAYFGVNLFWVFYRSWASEDKVRRALKICKEKNKKDVPYFLGIVKKL